MTKRPDPHERRQEIVEAAFRLLVAEGITGVSLRKVAAESGINIGSVRHYFTSHEELLEAAAIEAGERMGRRLAHHPGAALRGLTGQAALDGMQAIIEDVLPMDEPRTHEAIVVMELIMASRTMPVFRPVVAQMGKDLVVVLEEALVAVDSPAPRSDAEQLAAFIGGLTIDAITPHGTAAPIDSGALVSAFVTRLLMPGR